MKPFDLELARQGYPVCTRDGHKVRILCFDRKSDYNIVALVEDDKLHENTRAYSDKGELCIDMETNDDLIMAPIKCEGWANIYPSTDRKYYTFGQSVLFITEEEAKRHRVNGGITVRIE